MKYTTSEARIMDYMKRKSSHTADVDELAAVFYSGRPRPMNWRQVVLGMMGKLRLKAEVNGAQLDRISSIGRGRKAIYQLSEPAEAK